MAFVERVLSFAFSGAQSGDFSAAGLRAIASIQASQGRIGSMAQIKIWGLSPAQMNAYSAKIPTALSSISPFNLVITAGDLEGELSEVINANIWESFIDLTGAPDSAFVVTVVGIYTAANPMGAQSPPPVNPGTPSTQNAETLIGNICALAGYTLRNNGAHAVLRNQSTYGSALDQIERIAQAANFAWSWSGTTFSIWPADGVVDDVVIDVGPNTTPQMVGFPQYWEQGIIVTSLFNPEVHLGRRINVVGSSLTKANGLWQIVGVQHDLSTMLGKGPWFTTAKLAAPA